MSERRLVGIDLGIASAHTVRVLREDRSEVCRRRCRPRLDSLLEVEAAALAGAPQELRLEVVIEPTGPAWLSISACRSRSRGCRRSPSRSAVPSPTRSNWME